MKTTWEKAAGRMLPALLEREFAMALLSSPKAIEVKVTYSPCGTAHVEPVR